MGKMYPGATWESAEVNAAWNPLQVTGTNFPGFFTGDRELGVSPLFKSHREAALIGEGYVLPNLGALPAGVVVARVKEGAKAGWLVPVDFAITPVSSTTTTFTVTEAEATLFAVGDAVDGYGEITSIAAPSDGTVVITGSKTTTTAATTVTLKIGEGRMVIDQAVFSDGRGAQTSFIYNNAVVYRAKLVNVDDAAIAAAGWLIDGQFVIMK